MTKAFSVLYALERTMFLKAANALVLVRGGCTKLNSVPPN